MMRSLKLNFSRRMFIFHVSIVASLCILIVLLYGVSLKNFAVTLGVLLLYIVISTIRSKSFVFDNDKLSVKYIFFRHKTYIEKNNVDCILYHKKKGEKDWNYIKVCFKNGKSRKLNFSFVKSTDQDIFFSELSDHFIIEPY